jgi:hypothetical protein
MTRPYQRSASGTGAGLPRGSDTGAGSATPFVLLIVCDEQHPDQARRDINAALYANASM